MGRWRAAVLALAGAGGLLLAPPLELRADPAAPARWPLQKIAAPAALELLCYQVAHGSGYVSSDARYGSARSPAELITFYRRRSGTGSTLTVESAERARVDASDGPHREAVVMAPPSKEETGCGKLRRGHHRTVLSVSRETRGPE